MAKFKVALLIPCFNEAESIESVISSVPHNQIAKLGGSTEIIVIDNNSTDNTAEIALRSGAKVIFEEKKGKGNAMRTGFESIGQDVDFVVMLDGDGTYDPKEMPRLIELLASGFSDVAMGSRLGGTMTDGSMTAFNRMGNWIFTNLVRQLYSANTTDVLTGYFAWNRLVIDELRNHLESDGFAIEMEMVTKMSKLGNTIASVPITYSPRAGSSNLKPVQDGTRIFGELLKNLGWNPGN
jgi:dolichol-phosphate mannosyltransferase